MGNVNAVVDLQHDGDVAVITMDNPPVNALGHALRTGIEQALAQVRHGEGGAADRHRARVLRRRGHHGVRQGQQAADPDRA